MLKKMRRILVGATWVAVTQIAFAQTSVEVPKGAEKGTSILEHLDHLHSYIRDRIETIKAEKAINNERSKMQPGETKKVEVVTTGGPLMAGGTFVRVQEVKEGPKIAAEGEKYSQPITIGGGLPAKEFTPEEKKEMRRKADEAMRAEKLLKDVQQAEKALKEVRDAAEKARADLEAKEAEKRRLDLASKQAAEEQARLARQIEIQKQEEIRLVAEKARVELEASQAAAAAATKAAKDAADARAKAARDAALANKQELAAERNGREITREIQNERARFKAAGGPFRAPAGSGGPN